MIGNKSLPKIVAGLMAVLVVLCFCAMGYRGTFRAETAATTEEELLSRADPAPDYGDSHSCRITLTGNGASVSSAGASASGSTVVIDRAGTYVVTGKLDNGMILVESLTKGDVRLVLDGAEIANSGSAAIYVREAENVVVTSAENSENTLSHTGTYLPIDKNNIDGVIFSKSDLTLNGSGVLNISADEGHGVVSKDELIVTGGSYRFAAAGQGLSANDKITVTGGSFSIHTTGDAIHCDGDILLSGGEFDLATADDGVHADGELTISGGRVTVSESKEGLEGRLISIQGGEISVTAADDGVNASGGTSADDAHLDISGGTLYVDSGGDGLDSNGAFVMSGGRVQVDGPTSNYDSALDYETEATVTGGVFMSVGSAGMAENFGEASTQGAILVTVSGSAGDTVSLTDDRGNELLSYRAGKPYASVLVSCPEIALGGVYTLTAGETAVEISMDSLIYGSGFGGFGGFGMGGKGGHGGKGEFGGGFKGDKAFPRQQTEPSASPSPQTASVNTLTVQSMSFGGGQEGQRPEGGRPEGMGPGGKEPPEGFDPSQFDGEPPEGFDPSQFKGGFEPPELPSGDGEADPGVPDTSVPDTGGRNWEQFQEFQSGRGQFQDRFEMDRGGFPAEDPGSPLSSAAVKNLIFYGACLAILAAALIFAALYPRRSRRR